MSSNNQLDLICGITSTDVIKKGWSGSAPRKKGSHVAPARDQSQNQLCIGLVILAFSDFCLGVYTLVFGGLSVCFIQTENSVHIWNPFKCVFKTTKTPFIKNSSGYSDTNVLCLFLHLTLTLKWNTKSVFAHLQKQSCNLVWLSILDRLTAIHLSYKYSCTKLAALTNNELWAQLMIVDFQIVMPLLYTLRRPLPTGLPPCPGCAHLHLSKSGTGLQVQTDYSPGLVRKLFCVMRTVQLCLTPRLNLLVEELWIICKPQYLF